MILSKNDCERLLEAFEIYEEIADYALNNFQYEFELNDEQFWDKSNQAYNIFMNFKEYIEENS